MAPRTWITNTLVASLAFASLLAAGCGAKKPVETAPKPELTQKEDWPAPPPKPKKCEALEEKCAATDTTKARVAKASFTITPIAKWKYAQTANVTIAQTSDDGAVMAVVGYESANPKDDIKNREAALDAAAKEVGLTLPKKKVAWKSPIDTKDAAGLKIGLWEWEGAQRKDKKGTLLVFGAPLSDNKGGIVGFGFVPDDDKDADKIVEGLQTSIGSIATAEKKADAAADKSPDGKK